MTPRNIFAVLCLLLLNRLPAFALEQRETLKGLPGVEVSVNVFGLDDVRNRDLQRSLQIDTELRIRQNKIKVLDTSVSGRPMFIIHANFYRSIEANVDSLAFCITSEVEQDVSLFRNSKMYARAVTYHGLTTIGLSNSGAVRDQVRSCISQLVDAFINDFLAENPLP